MTSARYLHRQTGTLTRISLGAAVAVTAALGIGFGLSAPSAARTAALLVCSSVGALLLVCLVLFSSLTVEVTREHVVVRFGPGPIRRTIALADLVDARPVRNRWWYGWGIRLTPHGWMFNVSGLDAVEVVFRDGHRFRIGTDEPKRLAAAIRAGIEVERVPRGARPRP